MNITSVKPKSFANGFDFFCPDCGVFFSAQLEPDCIGRAEYCPYCGRWGLIDGIERLLAHCTDSETEPIPNSRTGATPRQVEIIIGLAANRKRNKLPVTVEAVAGPSDYHRAIVQKVFEELQISETGGA